MQLSPEGCIKCSRQAGRRPGSQVIATADRSATAAIDSMSCGQTDTETQTATDTVPENKGRL